MISIDFSRENPTFNTMKTKQFAIHHQTKKSEFKFTVGMLTFGILSILSFCFFAIYSGVSKMVFSNDKVDLFTKDLSQISTYFMPVDRTLSQKILVLDEIIQSYMTWDNVFQTKVSQINDLRKYIIDNKSYLQKVWFERYEPLMELFTQMYDYRDEVYKLLWQNQPFHYLILLQNWNEKRPNGWFFGSFAFITFDGGHITDLQIVDSYLPDYIAPNTRLQAPKWFSSAFWEDKIWFIAGNKFGFTDMDWQNLKLLFEKMVWSEANLDRVSKMISTKDREMIAWKYIKWVVFLNSKLIEDFFPWFDKKMTERQFLNASTDIIRWADKSNKKEMYIQQINSYFQEQKFAILRNLVNNWSSIPQKHYLQFYFSNVSSGLQNLLVQNDLINIYSPDKIYTRDTNTANNKSDQFITKNVQLFELNMFTWTTDQHSDSVWEAGKLLLTSHTDILDISELPRDSAYRLVISYDFSVPESYITFIDSLAQKYQISLTPREKHILVTSPLEYTDYNTPHWRATRWMIFLPIWSTIYAVQWDVQWYARLDQEFAAWLRYRTFSDSNHTNKQITIDFSIQ